MLVFEDANNTAALIDCESAMQWPGLQTRQTFSAVSCNSQHQSAILFQECVL
jgi:hypothetical protein